MKPIVRVLCCALLLATALPAAASPDVTWTQLFGGGQFEWGRDVVATADGGYIIVADTESYGPGGYDVWLIKTDAYGNQLWTRTFGGLYEERGFAVRQTDDGGFIIVGTTGSYGAGAYDIWLIKTDSDGYSSWDKTFGGSAWDWGYSVEITSDGGYAVIGYTESYGPGMSAAWLIKTDDEGNTLWTKTYGGTSSDWGQSIVECSDGGFAIAGDTYSFGAGSRDAWLIRTDSVGDTLWTRTFGGSASDGGRSVLETDTGGCILAGCTKSYGAGDDDLLLVETDSSGHTLWTKIHGGTEDDGAESIVPCTGGGYIIAGHTESFGAGHDDMWIVRIDAGGDSLWTLAFGDDSHDWARFARQSPDGGYIVVGDSYDFFNGEYNVRLLKLDSETGVPDSPGPQHTTLAITNSHPNPFVHATSICYQLPAQSNVTVDIYNICGRRVRTLLTGLQAAGSHTATWDGRDETGAHLAAGVYFCRLQAGGQSASTKLVIIR